MEEAGWGQSAKNGMISFLAPNLSPYFLLLEGQIEAAALSMNVK